MRSPWVRGCQRVFRADTGESAVLARLGQAGIPAGQSGNRGGARGGLRRIALVRVGVPLCPLDGKVSRRGKRGGCRPALLDAGIPTYRIGPLCNICSGLNRGRPQAHAAGVTWCPSSRVRNGVTVRPWEKRCSCWSSAWTGRGGNSRRQPVGGGGAGVRAVPRPRRRCRQPANAATGTGLSADARFATVRLLPNY